MGRWRSWRYVDLQDSKFTDDWSAYTLGPAPNLTLYAKRISKIRLQTIGFFWSRTFSSCREVESVFLQWDFIIGAATAPHKF